MKKIKKLVAILLALGTALSMAGCAFGQANAGANTSEEEYESLISSKQQGKTLALLGGDIYLFASNYTEKMYAKNFAVGDFKVDRYAPKAAKLTWENQRDGALYYTVKIGDDKELTDADSYVVSGTSIEIDYLYAATEYYYQIYAHYEDDEVLKSRVFNFRTADLPRTVFVEGVSNTRDLGGRLTVDGKHRIKQGMIYRGGEVDKSWGKITEEGKRVMVEELGIKTDLDLRDRITLTKSPIDASLNYVNVSAPYYVVGNGITTASYKEALITEIRTFANPDNYPIYLHCSLGRDRAGTLSFLLSALLGMNEMDIFRDYEMSFFSVNGWADASQGAGKIDELVPTAFTSLYNYIKDYGDGTMAENAELFMKNYLGITQTEIDTIREVMLEEV